MLKRIPKYYMIARIHTNKIKTYCEKIILNTKTLYKLYYRTNYNIIHNKQSLIPKK